MEYHQITLSEWLTAKEELRKALQDTKTAFVRTGYWLRKIEDGKLFEQEGRGFKSVAEYAEAEYNISPSTCSRLMAINRQFSADGYSLELAEPYRGFSFGLLVEMKDISEEGRAMITPDTPREDIREIRRYEREAGTIVEEPPKSPDYHPAIRAFLESLGEKEISAQAAAAAKGPKAVFEEVAPSGRRLFRHGVYLVNFTERQITIRKFGQGDESVSWEEYAEAFGTFMEEKHEETAETMPAAGTEVPDTDVGNMELQIMPEPEGGEEQTEGLAEETGISERQQEEPGENLEKDEDEEKGSDGRDTDCGERTQEGPEKEGNAFARANEGTAGKGNKDSGKSDEGSGTFAERIRNVRENKTGETKRTEPDKGWECIGREHAPIAPAQSTEEEPKPEGITDVENGGELRSVEARLVAAEVEQAARMIKDMEWASAAKMLRKALAYVEEKEARE